MSDYAAPRTHTPPVPLVGGMPMFLVPAPIFVGPPAAFPMPFTGAQFRDGFSMGYQAALASWAQRQGQGGPARGDAEARDPREREPECVNPPCERAL